MADRNVTFGLNEKLAYVLIYLFGWLSGLIFYVSEKDDKTIRVHALQALIFSAAYFAVVVILLPLIFGAMFSLGAWAVWATISTILWIAYWVVIILCIIRAVNGNILKIPVVYDIAAKHA